jgi:hypothetical protein
VLQRSLAQQLDLAHLRSRAGLVLFENLAFAPLGSVVPPPQLPVDSRRPNLAALATDLSSAVPLTSSPTSGVGTVLWGEAYDSEWQATSRGARLEHVRSFGWANGYELDGRGTVSISYSAQWTRWLMLAGALVIWVFVAWRWRRTRARRDPTTRRAAADRARRNRHDRQDRRDPLAELDDEAFWWERV